MFAALAVFLFSAAQLAKIFLEYKKGTDEYNRVREYVTTTEPEEETQEPLEGGGNAKAYTAAGGLGKFKSNQ